MFYRSHYTTVRCRVAAPVFSNMAEPAHAGSDLTADLQESSGNCHTLSLTSRQQQATVPNHGAVALGKLTDEVVCIGSTCSCLNLVLRAMPIETIADVVGYAACKPMYILVTAKETTGACLLCVNILLLRCPVCLLTLEAHQRQASLHITSIPINRDSRAAPCSTPSASISLEVQVCCVNRVHL